MTAFIYRGWVLFVAFLVLVLMGVAMVGSGVALAAPPYVVEYAGVPMTTAVPGKEFTVNFKVTNTGTTVYSGVKVIFHIPKELTHMRVSPGGAEVVDDTITWSNVPIQSGGAFKPSITLKMDNGVALKTKTNIWVQVTGESLEETSQNFSVTAVTAQAATKKTTVSSGGLVSKINSIHRIVYGRNPTASEHAYWLGRVTRGEKATFGALLGAMQYHKRHGISH